jgi:hypothetical protein
MILNPKLAAASLRVFFEFVAGGRVRETQFLSGLAN